MDLQELVCAHSPDSDDAYMFYGLATRKVRSKLVNFKHKLEDIQSLNRRAMNGEYELTAISYHAYPYVADKYAVMASGSSVGDGYGPMLVALHPMDLSELKGKRIAIPGRLTTAFLTLNIIEPDFVPVEVAFDKILDAAGSLTTLPDKGNYPKELEAFGNREFRQIFFKPYRLIYQVAGKHVTVMLVADGRRDMPALLAKRLLG